MKKSTFTAILASFSFVASAQFSNIDFESFPLSQADTFYNGSDLAGGFTIDAQFNQATFTNTYTVSTWGDYWNGFICSNMTDVTTAGYGNQYSAFPGSGANGSQQYSICYPNGTIIFFDPTFVDSIKITNTTFAGISMRDGDAYGKQFGSNLNASGTDDGTNGNDFFRLWIIGIDAAQQLTDSVELYLADYRFPNASEDYILDTWTTVDLTALGAVKQLTFRLESSDNSFGFMNTPGYFALDNLDFHNVLGIGETAIDPVSFYQNSAENTIIVKGLSGKLTLTDVSGKIISSSVHDNSSLVDLKSIQAGVYLLSLENEGKVYTKTVLK